MENVFFVVTIDTECDRSLSWRASNPLTFHSVVEGIPSRLQPLFRKYGCRSTYLVSSEVLDDAASVRTLRALEADEAELGTHLHGAYVPPQRVYRDPAGSETPEFQCHYSEPIEAAKLKNLTELFRTRLDRTPTAFRAGRFGASARTLRLLEPLGYRVDTSVTPHMVWDEQIDFRSAPEQPYHPDVRDLNARGASTILEVPVTIGEMRRHIFFRRPLWLRPSYASAEQMITLCDSFIRKYGQQEPVVLNMMFHSMEVIPMASPYTRTEAECSELLGRIEQVLGYLASRGVKSVGLSELVGLL